MTKKIWIVALLAIIVSASVSGLRAQESKKERPKIDKELKKALKLLGKYNKPTSKMEMIWHDEFNDNELDLSKWDTITRGPSDWNRYMSYDPSLISFEDGNVVLEGRKTPVGSSDTSKYITGGIWTKNSFSFLYGRIDIRAKLGEAKGAWPAFWLLPDVEARVWPDDGEIDIMEHLNYDGFVYQTVHSAYTVKHNIKNNPKHGGTGKIDRNDYNVYSIVWSDKVIVWLINDVPTFYYPRLYTEQAIEKRQWPFDNPYFILFSPQLGGPNTWVGEIYNNDLPVKMWIAWLRVSNVFCSTWISNITSLILCIIYSYTKAN